MGRNLSPMLRRELENLDKDADSRKSAMKALKSYVKDLDSKAIPIFLAQVSETKDSSSSSVEHTISLYEVLARVHGPKIVPQIDNIMSTIIRTLASSTGSFPLQQACSKVVPAIARYAIDPSTPEDKKRAIIYSLCKPLSDSLLGSQESLSFGAALCLKALVDSDNWRFAPDEIVNEVCLRVAGALEEKPTQTKSHMGLAMALGKHNSFTIEAYAGSLIRSGLQILNAGVVEGNSQKRLSAIQMVNFLMKCVDPRSILFELDAVIEEMEKCSSDQMAFVKGAAFEALQTATMISEQKGSRLEKESSSVTGSNFSKGKDYYRRKNVRGGGDKSPVSSASPESQTVHSFVEYPSWAESPMSTAQSSCNCNRRSVSRKLWRNESEKVNISLKDGSHSNGFDSNGYKTHSECFENENSSEDGGDNSEVFSGFVPATRRNGLARGVTPMLQERSCTQANTDDIRIFTTPRKLLCSLQDQDDVNSDFSTRQAGRSRTPASSKSEWNTARNLEGNYLNGECNGNESSEKGEGESDCSESVASTCNVATDADPEPEVSHELKPNVSHELEPKVSHEAVAERARESQSRRPKSIIKVVLYLVLGLFFAFCAVMLNIMWSNNEDSSLVPT